MTPRHFPTHWGRTFWTYTLLLCLAWTILVGGSLAWNLSQHRQALEESARVLARTALGKDVLYRRWSAEHGGVYVLRSEGADPNPYLPAEVEATIVDQQGREYLLVNPAWMTRQIFSMEPDAMGIQGHITSLKPINPNNAPDEWERKALAYLDDTREAEYSELVIMEGKPVVRLMRPLFVEAACLQCHEQQGYQLGEIRGAISESVQLAPILASGEAQARSLVWAHLGLWGFGLVAIGLAGRRLYSSMRHQEEVEERLLQLSTHDALTGVYNRTYFEQTLDELAASGSSPVSVIVADVDQLKEVNDTQGHQAGDKLLRCAAALLHEYFRQADIIARIGGDEFVVILPRTDATTAEQILQRVRSGIAAGLHDEPGYPPLSLSLGSATTENANELLEIFRQADQEMYAEKARKKGRTDPKAFLS